GPVAEIDHRGSGGNGRPDAVDPVSDDDDDRVVHPASRLHVEQAGSADGDRGSGGRLGGGRQDGAQGRSGKSGENGSLFHGAPSFAASLSRRRKRKRLSPLNNLQEAP